MTIDVTDGNQGMRKAEMGLKWHKRAGLSATDVQDIAKLVVLEGVDLSLNDFVELLRLFLKSMMVEGEINWHEHEVILRAVWEIRK